MTPEQRAALGIDYMRVCTPAECAEKPMAEALELAYPGLNGYSLLDRYFEHGEYREQLAVVKVCAIWRCATAELVK